MVDVARESMINLVNIAVILSLSSRVVEPYSVPRIDAEGRLFLLIQSSLSLTRKVEAIVNGVGLALLFTLMIVCYNPVMFVQRADISQLIVRKDSKRSDMKLLIVGSGAVGRLLLGNQS